MGWPWPHDVRGAEKDARSEWSGRRVREKSHGAGVDMCAVAKRESGVRAKQCARRTFIYLVAMRQVTVSIEYGQSSSCRSARSTRAWSSISMDVTGDRRDDSQERRRKMRGSSQQVPRNGWPGQQARTHGCDDMPRRVRE